MSTSATRHDGIPVGVSAGVSTGYLAACCILSFLISKRLSAGPLASWMRALTLGVFVTTFVALAAQFIMLFGVGLSASARACEGASLVCILTYGLAKMSSYAFLAERVHMVDTRGLVPRYKSRTIQATFLVALVLIGLGFNGVIRRISEIEEDDGLCYIGLERSAAVPYLVVDIILVAVLSTCFVIPIWKSNFHDARLLAFKTGLAALLSLAATIGNLGSMVLFTNEEHWVCFLACAADLFVNAITIYLITNTPNPTIDGLTPQSTTHRPSVFSPLSTAVSAIVPKPAWLFSPRPLSLKWEANDLEQASSGNIHVVLPKPLSPVLTKAAEFPEREFVGEEEKETSWTSTSGDQDIIAEDVQGARPAPGLTWV